MNYLVHVRYRTNSGCNTTDITVQADSPEHAIELATAKVRKRRGVIRIDGGDWWMERKGKEITNDRF